MSGSKLWSKKIELMHVHKNMMTTMSTVHITTEATELVNTPTKQPYSNDRPRLIMPA